MAEQLEGAPKGFYIGASSIRTALETMQDELKLPRDGETGQKLIRRSVAKLAPSRIGRRYGSRGR